ncbi:MAG: OmpA family protein [Deltaproteobacteria bacterium]|nr:OmpA family protein [Deltaproteobacteria bacterium]
MKKFITMAVYALVLLAMSLPASAIELSPDATNIPSDYASVKGGKVVFNSRSTAYSSITFNSILNSYGLTLAPGRVAEVPPSYAKVVNDKPVFNKTHIAYAPEDYHKIFTAYGLELSSEGAATLLGAVNYCNVVNDKIRFGNSSIAYGSKEMGKILAAYNLPGGMAVEKAVAVAEVKPVAAVVETDCIDSDGDTVCDEIDVCGATPKGVKVDERGCWTLEQTYLFDFDKAEVKSEFFPLLDHIAKVMSDNPKMTVELEGHTDSIGSVEYNQGLSERRANAIKDSLVKRTMIDAKRLDAVGVGESKPITTNETKEGRAKNRRVDLKPVW